MRMDAWVTSAVDEKEVSKALVLAYSLRKVYTSKKLVALTTAGLSGASRDKLDKTFDLVVPIQQQNKNGWLTLEESAKVEAVSLKFFDKCVYLSPNALVLENCDDMFDKYGSFAGLENRNGVLESSSVFLFSPSLEAGMALKDIVDSMGEGAGTNAKMIGLEPGSFMECINLWKQHNFQAGEKLDGSYHVIPNLAGDQSRSMKARIMHFDDGSHPLDCTPVGLPNWKIDCGPVEKFAIEPCKQLNLAKMETTPTVSGLTHQWMTFKNEPIAIVGLSFRLPGASNVDEFWDLLINGKEAISFVPDSRWTRERTHLPCQNRNVQAGFLSVPVDEFDASFFGISAKSAENIDPQHRLLHEVSWEALEDAMIDPLSLRGTGTGIFVGSWLQDYRDMLLGAIDDDFLRTYLGNGIGTGTGRLAHFLETTGPSIATESGCSSAMVAVDMACKSLRNRESNLALACGVNLLLKPFDPATISSVNSPDGRSKTFDEGADGFGRAEGCAVLILKRLSDAIREGDNVWGLIRGSAVTQEGVSKSFGTPTVHCESLAMERALSDAHVDPKDVSYIEAHGTGTPVGDPVEMEAITKAYSSGRSEPLVIGSVKTNVGHTESVSGITGILKVLLSMRNEKIPKHLNLEKLNPAINLDAIPAKIPLETEPWLRNPLKARIAGVSSFGISGTDCHVIIQEPMPNLVAPLSRNDVTPRPLHLMKISAKSKESLKSLLGTYEALFNSMDNDNGKEFADWAYSANIGRATFNHRAVVIASNFKEAGRILKEKSYKHAEIQSTGGRLCFLFTGQGSQYPQMAHSLYRTSPTFKDHFDMCDQILTKGYGINIRKVLWGQSPDGSELSRTLYSQASIFCVEYCLLKLWESWGVRPDYVMGHSMGEFAAAVAVGVLDLDDALMLVAERSRLIDGLPRGKMLVIKADKKAVAMTEAEFKTNNPYFWIDYAAFNSPDQTVVAGDAIMLEQFAKFCGEKSIKTVMLAATHAFHSRHMEPIIEPYRTVADKVKRMPVLNDCPKYISGMEAKLIDVGAFDADYWVRHTRETVNYMDGCKVAQSEGCLLFLEIGPHPVLSAMTMINLEGQQITCLPSIRKNESEWVTMLDSMAKLYLSDWKGNMDWRGFDQHYIRSRVTLPFYPFSRKPIWKELECACPTTHPLLGRPVPAACEQTVFENKLTLKTIPFIQDHVIGNTVIFPGAAFLEMCLAGGHATVQSTASKSGVLQMPNKPIALQSLKIVSPLGLYEKGVSRLQTLTALDDMNNKNETISYTVGVHRFAPSGIGGAGSWVPHATAKFVTVPGDIPARHGSATINIDINTIQKSWETFDINTEFYEKLPDVGLRFGPTFRSLEMGWKHEAGILMSVNLPQTEEDNNFLIHPIVADAMIQATMLWTVKDKRKMKLHVPVGIGEFTWLQSSSSASRFIYCSPNRNGTNCVLLDHNGGHLAYMSGVDFVETSAKQLEAVLQQHGTSAMPKIWREVWKPCPGALQSAYDLTRTRDVQLFQYTGQQRQVLEEVNNLGECESSYLENLCDLSRLFFLNALYELGWKPKQGVSFTLGELVKLLPRRPKEHFIRYFRFFLKAVAETGMIAPVPNSQDMYIFPREPIPPAEIHKRLQSIVSPEDTSRVDYKLVVKTGSNLTGILLGNVEPFQLLFPSDLSEPSATQLYANCGNKAYRAFNGVSEQFSIPIFEKGYSSTVEINKAKYSQFSLPVLRILEVGSGTGGLTKSFLENFNALNKPYEFYFTDVSISFFDVAQQKFEQYSKNMVFKKLDLDEDPLAQGFGPNYFDMIIAYEVLHVAKDIRQSLQYLKCILKPGGLFHFIESTQPDPRKAQMFGILDTYWQFTDLELRPYHNTLTPDKWEQVLTEINCDMVLCTPAENNQLSIIAARLSPEDKRNYGNPSHLQIPKYSWLIFYHSSCSKLADILKEKLVGVNRTVRMVMRYVTCTEAGMRAMMRTEVMKATKRMQMIEGVLYLWGLSSSRTRDQSQISLPLVNLLQEIGELQVPPRLYVVTQGVLDVNGSEVTNPNAATLHGIAKSYCNENTAIKLSTLDLSPQLLDVEQANEIFSELWRTDKGSKMTAFRDHVRFDLKLCSTKVNKNEPLDLPNGSHRFQLILPNSRLISDLEFDLLENYVLAETDVEVQVKAAALSFRDLLTVFKPTLEFESVNSIGVDFSGVVTKAGSKVVRREVGDLVTGMNIDKKSSLPSHIIIDEALLVPLPAQFTFEEGASLPVVSTTVLYCLLKLAKMERGETVLIHTASGGVGLCAIQLANHVGANIIATVGNKRKENYLRSLGIKHIFNSRTTHFGKQILEVTNGKGVDIVLNSLTGEGFKEASLSTLAQNGRFIEMSKLNVWKPEEVKALRPDVFYNIFDLETLGKSDLEDLIEQFRTFLDTGIIHPIPYDRFDAIDIKSALSHLHMAKHIGKVVCVMPEVKVTNSKITTTTQLLNPRSTYLVTGGLGGIGFEVLQWMLNVGAKHIAIACRRPPTTKIQEQLDSWNKYGQHIEVFQVDIGDHDQCQLLFKELKSPHREFPPIRGVMHTAGVLADASMTNQNWDNFSHTYNPKVNGTCNLHDLTKDLLLEHFVLFSSFAASLGTPCQSNHAASCCFEDAFALYRRSNGLPATSINWANWGEIGVATALDLPGIRPITTSEGIHALEAFLRTHESNLTLANIDSFALAAKFFPNLRDIVDDQRLFGEERQAPIVTRDEFWKNVDSADLQHGKLVLFREIIKFILRRILRMGPQETISDFAEFQTLGVDSLMMMGMRNELQNIMGPRLNLTARQLKDCSNTDELANLLVAMLEDPQESKAPTIAELHKMIEEDAHLPEHIRPSQGMRMVHVTEIQTVFVTGATGMLGPYLLRELSHRPSIKKIFCLVRKMRSISPTERLTKRLEEMHLDGEVDMTKVECIQGDIASEKFGLSEEDYIRLAARADAVVNSAVRSDHTEQYFKLHGKGKMLDHRNVNSKGTIRILEFAVYSKLKHVYQASSLITAFAMDTGTDDEDPEGWKDIKILRRLQYNMGYPISKFVSEELCRQAGERGIPCKAFRHPFIGGDSRTGRCDYKTNHVILLLLAFLKLRCVPDVHMPMAALPVDHCARISLDIFFNPVATSNDVYNISHSGDRMDNVVTLLGKEFGIPIRTVSLPEFLNKVEEAGDQSPLAGFKSLYRDNKQALLDAFQDGSYINTSLKRALDTKIFFTSQRLEQLTENYDDLETTEVVMTRDFGFLKEAGIFEKFGIK